MLLCSLKTVVVCSQNKVFSFLLFIFIIGSCQCKELAEKVQELKLINAQRNNRIGILELQIKTVDFPYQKKVKELEDCLSFYKSKVRQLE
jgi:hypothetical protein